MSQYEQFWEKFRVVIIQQGVPEGKALWYVKWVRSFARSMRKPLVQRTPEEVNAFLDKLTGQPEVKVWQKEQAKEALRILYEVFLRPNIRIHSCDSEMDKGPVHSVIQDAMDKEGVRKQFQEALEKLLSEIRFRHYSYRTEQTYEDWVCRFLTFHKLKPPQELGADAVKSYLDYLALRRRVSASTQNQALNA